MIDKNTNERYKLTSQYYQNMPEYIGTNVRITNFSS